MFYTVVHSFPKFLYFFQAEEIAHLRNKFDIAWWIVIDLVTYKIYFWGRMGYADSILKLQVVSYCGSLVSLKMYWCDLC